MHIPKIVITGGPCAGKTTALSRVTKWCQERGFHPIIVHGCLKSTCLLNKITPLPTGSGVLLF